MTNPFDGPDCSVATASGRIGVFLCKLYMSREGCVKEVGDSRVFAMCFTSCPKTQTLAFSCFSSKQKRAVARHFSKKVIATKSFPLAAMLSFAFFPTHRTLRWCACIISGSHSVFYIGSPDLWCWYITKIGDFFLLNTSIVQSLARIYFVLFLCIKWAGSMHVSCPANSPSSRC